jgi:hypothetical protein
VETTRKSATKSASRRFTPPTFSPKVVKTARWCAGIGVVLLLIAVIVILVGYLTCQISGQIMPGVTVGGMPLEGLSLERAAQELDRVWNRELRLTAVDSSDADRAWVVTPADFGLGVDARSTAMRAFSVGRGQGLIRGIGTWLRGFQQPTDVLPWVYLDEIAARHGLETWAEVVAIPAAEAQLSVDNGDVAYQPGRFGRVLDVEASLALLEQDPSAILTERRLIPLVTSPSEPKIVDASEAADTLEGMLHADVSLRAYDPVTDETFEWKPDRESIASWVALDRNISSISVGIETEAIEEYLQGLDDSLGEERSFDHEEARVVVGQALEGEASDPILIHYLPTSYVIVSGDNLVSIGFKVSMPFWKLLEENPMLSRRGLRVGETLVVPPKDSLLELPVVMGKRIVISITEQRMWVYENGDLYREYVVSTGIDSSPTMPGIFQVMTHELNAYASIWDLYMPHFLGIYYATPDLLNGIHGLPLLSSGRRLWADVLGRPASYGCIILDLEAGEALYNWAENGVVVEIRP